MGKVLIYKKRKHLNTKIFVKKNILKDKCENFIKKDFQIESMKKNIKNKKKSIDIINKTENNDIINVE